MDDLDEELVESWFQTLADRRANRRLDAALRTYSERLEEELGVPPSDRLLALPPSAGRRAESAVAARDPVTGASRPDGRVIRHPHGAVGAPPQGGGGPPA